MNLCICREGACACQYHQGKCAGTASCCIQSLYDREPDFSRLTVYIFCVVNIFMEWGVRLLIDSLLKDMRKRGLNQKQILLVGYSRAAEEYIDRLCRILSGDILSVESGYNVPWQGLYITESR